uniref:Uncharacterized protein n=1 Tax=Cacopsylla melanoneura TaxID=428564 RepID=A0A8D8TDA1_9HEMI
MLLKKLQNKKYKDSKHEEGLRQKLSKLELMIKTAEATEASNTVSIDSPVPTDLIETTIEDETIYTFPTQTPPTPPVISHRIPSPTPNTDVYRLYEFTLLSNQSFVFPPWSSTETLTTDFVFSSLTNSTYQQNTSVPVPSSTPVTKTVQNDKNVSTVQHFFDLVDIPEDLPIPVTALKRKIVQEDYFGSISTKTESIRDLLRRLKNRMGTKKPLVSQSSSTGSSEHTDLWFTTNVTDYLLANFSRASCTNNDLYNEFLPSNQTLALSSTSSSPIKQLVGTRYIKLCQKCPDRGSNSRTLLFLIETRFLLDVDQYRQESSKGLKFQDLINIIELQSRIKVLQFKRKTKTFKVLREFSTKSNPRQLVNKLVLKLGVSNQRVERD